MRADNTHHVIAAAKRRADQTRQRAQAALRRMDAAGQRVTFDAVAREAEISRSWLYAQDDLRAEIERLRRRHHGSTAASSRPTGSAPPTPRCYGAWRPPPRASDALKPRTRSSVTPSPGPSANAGPQRSSGLTPIATRRTGRWPNSSAPAEPRRLRVRQRQRRPRTAPAHSHDRNLSSRQAWLFSWGRSWRTLWTCRVRCWSSWPGSWGSRTPRR
ncbi:DUF6262 family protein [Streptosporangium sp. V21-05]|uniref:DUF6262 family protein n=1 Tax=Streptosporangium sp. V21-05 TaxID=3446115 RepID=UPI003F531D30